MAVASGAASGVERSPRGLAGSTAAAAGFGGYPHGGVYRPGWGGYGYRSAAIHRPGLGYGAYRPYYRGYGWRYPYYGTALAARRPELPVLWVWLWVWL